MKGAIWKDYGTKNGRNNDQDPNFKLHHFIQYSNRFPLSEPTQLWQHQYR